MRRIMAFYRRPKTTEDADQLDGYLEALFEAVKHIPGSEFEPVAKEIAKETSPLKKPMPAQFLSLHARLFRDRHVRAHVTEAMTPEEQVATVKTWQSGLISKRTAYHQLEAGEKTRPGIDFEAEEKEINTETPADIPDPSQNVDDLSS